MSCPMLRKVDINLFILATETMDVSSAKPVPVNQE